LAKRYYLSEGRWEVDEGFERGQVRVRSETEWRRRYRSMQRVMMRKTMVDAAAVIIIFWSLHIALALQLEGGSLWTSVPLLVLFIILLLAMGPLNYVMRMWRFDDAPSPGLYRDGVQMTPEAFLPYVEIGEVRRKAILGLMGRREVVRVRERRKRKNFPYRKLPWTLWIDFLGEDGAEELEARVHAAGSPE